MSDWLEVRKTGIGGSDAAAICNLSRYRTPLQVYLDKIGQSQPIEETPEMKWGKKLEPLVLREYQDVRGVSVTPDVFLANRERPWMLGTLDGLSDDGRVVECKTVGFDRGKEWGEDGSDFVPTEYLLQVQHYLAVTGIEVADIAALFHGSNFRIFTVQADPELISVLIDREAEFWARVLDRNPPPPTGDDVDLMRLVYPVRDEVVSVPEHVVGTVRDYETIGEQIGRLKKQRDTCKVQLLDCLKGASVGELPDGRKLKQTVVDKKSYTVKASSSIRFTVQQPEKVKVLV